MNMSTEIQLETPRGVLAGLRGRDKAEIPVLCLHGWLDNAASFLPLSAELTGLDLVALDLPGHGKSFHRHPTANYYFLENLRDVDAALDALDWDSCHLVGHSMGAALAALFAAAAPERVRSLVMLDAVGPVSEPVEKCVARLQKSLHTGRSAPKRKKAYASIEDMIRVRQANTDLPDEPARLICERSAKRVEEHYEWTNDPALYWVSPVIMAEEQAVEFLRAIKSPVLSLTAQPFARFIREAQYRSRIGAIPHGRHELLAGDHHFHMDQAEKIAGIILPHIMEQERHYGTRDDE